MEKIMIVCVVGIITYGVYRLFELYARRRERIAMIEKLSSGIDPEVLKVPLHTPKYKDISTGSWAIRIGLLLIGIGSGVVIATIMDLSLMNEYQNNNKFYYELRNVAEVLYPACAAVFGGIGLVIAYVIEQKNEKESRKNDK
ncbi:MAG: hypothetical protein LBR26_11065 [Prevotella sp.]|jgi:hypothetical protein|nr:hypothetical protein [Prevotella sp.]